MVIGTDKAQECMRHAISCAARSKAEDERPHPLVGAVLSDLSGNVLLTVARGEFEPGLHAEAGLIRRAKQKGIGLTETALFSTLEPCTWRSRSHVPCAIQVQKAEIPLVYIGMIDPDLRICGRGESYLSISSTVERFPAALRQELVELHALFLASKLPALVWAVKTYGIEPPPADRPRLSLLHMSQDLIATSDGEIWISGGDLSWQRELQPALLRAYLDERRVRILVNREISQDLEEAALAIGATVAHATRPLPLRAAFVAPGTNHAQVLILERGNVHKLGCPEDQTLIDTLCQTVEERCGHSRAGKLRIRKLDDAFLLDALRRHVPQYANVVLEFRELPINILCPLPSSLEEFKLARWDLLSRTIERYCLPDAFAIEGSPWPCTPPVVEVYPDNMHVIIDGSHRVFADRNRGKATIRSIVAQMPNFDSVPAVPRGGWIEVGRSYETVPREVRYQSYDHGEFREIREAFRIQIEATPDATD